MGGHARFSPSSGKRRLECPPSLLLEEQFPDEESPFAAEGSAGHAMAEYLINKYLKKRTKRPVSDYYSDELLEAVDDYVEYNITQIEQARKDCDEPFIEVELKVSLAHRINDCFGTADMVVVDSHKIHIIDLKLGKGVVVDAEQNVQLPIWDAILFDTGEICVRFDTIPTNSSYLAESSLVTGNDIVAFTAITGKVISFRPKDDDGTKFEYVDHAPVFLDPYNRRYLVTDAEGTMYTVGENALSVLEETELTAELFETYGVQDIPDGKLLLTLKDPTILYWHDSENRFPDMKVTYSGIPIPQVLYSENVDMSDSTILGIEKVTADCADTTLFAVSFDNGESWWSCVDSKWMRMSEKKFGMSKSALEAISVDSWAEKATTGQIKYRFIISGADGYLKSITTDYLNTEE